MSTDNGGTSGVGQQGVTEGERRVGGSVDTHYTRQTTKPKKKKKKWRLNKTR